MDNRIDAKGIPPNITDPDRIARRQAMKAPVPGAGAAARGVPMKDTDLMESILVERGPAGHFVFETPIIDDERITLEQLAVYLILTRRADNSTRETWPSYSSIAKESRVSRRAAIYAVKVLVDLGYLLKRGQAKDNGEQGSNVYTIVSQLVEKPREGSAHHAPPSAGHAPSSAPGAPELLPLNYAAAAVNEETPNPPSEPSSGGEKDGRSEKSPKVSRPPAPDVRPDFETKQWIGVTAELFEHWEWCYPAVDIELEMRSALDFAYSHPEKQYTKWLAYLTGWFRRTQQRKGAA